MDQVPTPSPTASLVGPAAPSPWDPPLADAMADVGRIIYEEDMLEPLLADLAR